MELMTSQHLHDAISGLRMNGLFHLNGFLSLIDKQNSGEMELSPKTSEILIRVFEKEIELLYDASQFCLSDPDHQRIKELQECAALLNVIIDYLKTLPLLHTK